MHMNNSMSPTRRLLYAITGSFLLQATVAGANGPNLAPMRLSETELETVTAGSVLIDASAIATAAGINTITTTNTTTTVLGSGTIEIGAGFADAYACCGTYIHTEATVNAYAQGTTTGSYQHSSTVGTGADSQSTAFGTAYSIGSGGTP
jgi:hypothetical protein